LHWAIQAAGITYPMADAPVDVRIGPNGPTGVFALPLGDVVDLARGAVTRTLTPAECDKHGIEPCPVGGGGLAAPAGAGPRDLPIAASARSVAASADRPLAGTTVTMWGGVIAADGLGDELAAFQEQTGITVKYRTFEDAGFRDDMEPGELPDLLHVGWDTFPRLSRRGTLVDLSTFLDEATAMRAHGDYMIDLVSEGSGFYAVPENITVKGLVWYPVPEFEEAGYTVPRTWDELLALSRQMVADGRHPWCLGIESGVASGWLVTDWIEALVLRLGGVELYDQWVAHEIPFDHPVVRKATSMFGEIAFGPGFVNGGVESINDVGFYAASVPMYADPPGCWLNQLGDINTLFMPSGVAAGIDAGFFVLPPITAGQVVPTFGGAGFVSAARDRPEVREFIRHVSSPDWGAVRASRPGSTFVSAHAEFDPEHCRTAMWQIDVDPRIGDLRVQLCTAGRDSIVAGLWRHDGSDLMPPEVGSGTFWSGMVGYVDGGPSSLDPTLAGIDDAWPDG
jgi:alpha-glucoside transport system substrate-binding protein